LLKDSSFELTYEWIDKTGELVAKARTVHVFVDAKTWLKTEIDAAVRTALEKHIY